MMYAVFAELERTRVRVTAPMSWDLAQETWREMDDRRIAGRFPQVRHFVVRSTDDPKWKDAPDHLVRACIPGRGFKDEQQAARKAWRLFTGGKFRRAGEVPGEETGVQGTGGWFYWPGGGPAAQGLYGLARLCNHRGMIQRGIDGRYYVTGDSPVKERPEAKVTFVRLDRTEREYLLDIGRAAGSLERAKDAMFTALLSDDRFEHLEAETISDYAWAAAKWCFPREWAEQWR